MPTFHQIAVIYWLLLFPCTFDQNAARVYSPKLVMKYLAYNLVKPLILYR